MQTESIRGGDLRSAMQTLAKTLAVELRIDRAGICLLKSNADEFYLSELYTVREEAFSQHRIVADADAAEVFRKTSGKGIVAIDDTRAPNVLDIFAERSFKPLGIKSVMHGPIISQGELIGFVTCNSTRRRVQWTSTHKLFLAAISNLAALLVERNQRLSAETSERMMVEQLLKQQRALNSLLRSDVMMAGQQEKTFGDIGTALTVNLHVERVIVFTFDGQKFARIFVMQNGDVRPVAGNALGDLTDPDVVEELSRLILNGPVMINDCATSHLIANLYRGRETERLTQSVLFAPILQDGKLTGILACSMQSRTRQWTLEDALLIGGVANVVALAIERHRRTTLETELREAITAKDRFLANVSHEIRTPMNGVLGMTELLIQASPSAQQRKLLETIRESSKTLLSVINDILEVSRIDNNALRMNDEPFSVAASIEHVGNLLAVEASGKGIVLAMELDDLAHCNYIGDEARFRQVMLNVIGNAIKFTVTGSVTVTARIEALGPERNHVAIAIRDTGIGIAPDVRAKLFKPFVQADTSIRRRFGGTGLGLSIAAGIVEAMNGRIELDSELGAGTTINVYLPLKVATDQSAGRNLPDASLSHDLANTESTGSRVKAARQRSVEAVRSMRDGPAENAGGAQSGPAGNRAGLRVLVAEDNAINRMVAEEFLTKNGCLVTFAHDGVEAVAAAEHNVFDLILMDCQMPELDGLSASRLIRERELAHGQSPIPIIAVTADAFDSQKQECIASGMNDHIAKPYSEQRLMETLHKWVVPQGTLERRSA